MTNLIRIGQAARILNCDRTTLYRWENRGLVEPYKNEAGWRFYSIQQLEKLRQRQEPKPRGDQQNGS